MDSGVYGCCCPCGLFGKVQSQLNNPGLRPSSCNRDVSYLCDLLEIRADHDGTLVLSVSDTVLFWVSLGPPGSPTSYYTN